MTRNEIVVDEVVREDYKVPESIFDRKRTKTTHFMLNSIISNNTLMSSEYFVNAFLDDEGFKHSFENCLFLLFKAGVDDSKWNSIAQRLRAKSEYVMEYYVGIKDKRHLLMMVFRIPDKFVDDYLHFKNGKYSRFSSDYKKLFPKTTTNERGLPTESTIWRVLHKSPALVKELTKFFGEDVKFGKDDELWGFPEPKYEVYRHKTHE